MLIKNLTTIKLGFLVIKKLNILDLKLKMVKL